MANNRELSQFGNFISVNDTSENIGISTDVIISGVLTATRYYGDGSQLTGIATVGGGTTLGITTITDLTVTGVTSLTSLVVSGVSTFGNIVLDPVGIITAASGIVTYYGDGSNLSGVISGVGISTEGGSVGTGVTVIDFRGAGISTVTVGSGIGTIFVEGGGSGTVSISSVAPLSPENGDLWYSIDYGRTFVYYDETVLGIGSTAVWVDAAPFNIGVISLDNLAVADLTVTNSASITGLAVTNLNVTNINASGIITASSFVGDGSGLTGTGSTVFNDTTTNQEFYLTFTDITSGTITSTGISTSKLTYNPSTGEATAINFNSTSDINLKENIHTVENALETINSLRGVSFDWKETGKSSYGVIAQELEEFLPELVKQSEIKSVNYNGIIGILIEAIKELSHEIKELKNSSK